MHTSDIDRGASEKDASYSSMTIIENSLSSLYRLTPSPSPLVIPATATSENSLKQENETIHQVSIDIDSDVESVPTPTPPLLVPASSTSAEKHRTNAAVNSSESVRNWLQRISTLQQEIQCKKKASVAENTEAFNMPPPPTSSSSAQRVVKYQDLPYMGEMTLDNSKPRRGRKPKKADICHLIYKNYGTILPGTPKNLVESQSSELKKVTTKLLPQLITEKTQKTNVQSKIISSLLEKRLSQELQHRNKEAKKFVTSTTGNCSKLTDQNEPLNLCIRDLNQLKIRILRKQNNTYTSDSIGNQIKSEPLSDDDVEFVKETNSPKPSKKSTGTELDSLLSSKYTDSVSPGGGGYEYLPNTNVFIHPIALQTQLMFYQKMAEAEQNDYALNLPHENIPSSPLSSQDIPYDNELAKCLRKKYTEKQIEPEFDETSVTPDLTTKRSASQSTAPSKRKRSAIFIPPIPPENQTNPATEVSICKFKFTGGAKPSLQEKKMLSVDSGGNFRYYSGTGDKNMRGYEFFPRETLQQQAAAGSSHGTGTEAFLQASGEKVSILPHQRNLKSMKSDFLLYPDTSLKSISSGTDLRTSIRHRKRKTRKSLQREKLEQTFKEKGFLIQTQQLESAEGATYCKFRQLRKFTRYLFRSWKDYLPGNVQDLQNCAKSDEDSETTEVGLNAADLADI